MLAPHKATVATHTAGAVLVQTDSSKPADDVLQCSKAGGALEVSCPGNSSAAASLSSEQAHTVDVGTDAATHWNTQEQIADAQAAPVPKQHKAVSKASQKQGNLAKLSSKATSTGTGSSAAASNSKQKPARAASKAAASAISSANRTTPSSSLSATAAAASTALAAAKLGLPEQLASALAVAPAAAALRDVDGRCCLHYAAVYGHEECVDTLLAKGGEEPVRVRDLAGDLPLHLAAQKGQPMCAYNIAKSCPASCLVKNKRGVTPIDLAATATRGEVLNALLLACAGDGKSAVAVAAMRALLAAGAVPDTWAPNGSSALMLAAAADGVTALEVLLDSGASIELQDALGRSALMFAAGNNAAAACSLLLDRSASLSARDRRGRAAIEYATAGSEAAVLLQQRLQELEKVASRLQQQLLQEQGAGSGSSGSSSKGSGAGLAAGAAGVAASCGSSSATGSSSAKKKRKKKKGEGKGAAVGSEVIDAAPAAAVTAAADAAAVDDEGPLTGQGTAMITTSAAASAVVQMSQPSDSQQQQSDTASGEVPSQPIKLSQRAGHRQQQQQRSDVAGSASAAAVDATSAAVAAAAVVDTSVKVLGDCETAVQADEDWQVVLPKGKQRGPAAAAAAPSSSSGEGNGHAPGAHGTPRLANLVNGCRQQQQQQRGSVAAAGASMRQQQQAAGPGSSSSSSAMTSKVDVPGFANGCCHLNPLNTGHRRHGSSHSLCSTTSIASYESYCSSSAAAAAAGTPMSSCCSCISCCNHHVPQQHHHHQQQHQQVAHKPAAWGGAAAATAAAAVAAAAKAKDDSSSSSSGVACTLAAADNAGQSKQPASGHKSSSQPQLTACPFNAAHDSAAVSARDVESSAGFKAALLGPRASCITTAAVGDAVAAAAAAGSSPDPFPPLPPHPAAAAMDRSVQPVASTTTAQRSISHHQQPDTAPEASSAEQQQQRRRQDSELQQQLQQCQAEVAALKQLLKQQAVTHQQDLAAVLEDAATHEAAAVSTAAQAAAAETLQSPLLRQLLAAAAQQAVATERARMQLRLSQLGLPVAAQMQLMLGPLVGLEAVLGPAAAAAAAAPTAAAASATLDRPNLPGNAAAAAGGGGAVDCRFSDCQAASIMPKCSNSSGSGSSSSSTKEAFVMDSFTSILSTLQQQQHTCCSVVKGAMLSDLKLDLRSEYCGGGSSFVAPAKHMSKDSAATAASAAGLSRKHETDAEAAVDNKQAEADATAEALAYRICDGDWKFKDGTASAPHDCGNSSRRCSSNAGYFPDDDVAAVSCTAAAAATRSSSSSSLGLSTTDDAEVQETHVGGFGAIGGPPSCPNSFGSPRSSYSGSRTLSCSPAPAAADTGSSSSITFSCSPAIAAAAGAAAPGVTRSSGNFPESPTLGTSQWLGRNFRGSLLGTSQESFAGALQLPQLSLPGTPVLASCCGSHFDTLAGSEVDFTTAEAAVECIEHQLVGGLLMDEDCVPAEKCAVGCGRRWSATSGRSVIDLLPDQL